MLYNASFLIWYCILMKSYLLNVHGINANLQIKEVVSCVWLKYFDHNEPLLLCIPLFIFIVNELQWATENPLDGSIIAYIPNP